jgi:hypothetical protein
MFLRAFFGLKLGDSPKKIAEFFKTVITGIKFAGSIGDFLAHPAEISPAGFVRKVINRVSKQFKKLPIYFEFFSLFYLCLAFIFIGLLLVFQKDFGIDKLVAYFDKGFWSFFSPKPVNNAPAFPQPGCQARKIRIMQKPSSFSL